jgi:hypothetical protein
MIRGTSLLAAASLGALTAGPAAASVRALRYELTLGGSLSIVHDDQGLQANGAACGLGTPDETSPFQDHYTLSLRWSTTFNVTLGGKPRAIAARATRVSGGTFAYDGYAYDFNCNKIVYGPGGQPCSGTLADAGAGSLLNAHGSPARKPKQLTFDPQPFGALVATPASCTVDMTPQVTYTAADELGLESLGQTLAHTFRIRPIERTHTFRYKLHLYNNCSQPPQSPGETDSCATTGTASGSLLVRPR